MVNSNNSGTLSGSAVETGTDTVRHAKKVRGRRKLRRTFASTAALAPGFVLYDHPGCVVVYGAVGRVRGRAR